MWVRARAAWGLATFITQPVCELVPPCRDNMAAWGLTTRSIWSNCSQSPTRRTRYACHDRCACYACCPRCFHCTCSVCCAYYARHAVCPQASSCCAHLVRDVAPALGVTLVIGHCTPPRPSQSDLGRARHVGRLAAWLGLECVVHRCAAEDGVAGEEGWAADGDGGCGSGACGSGGGGCGGGGGATSGGAWLRRGLARLAAAEGCEVVVMGHCATHQAALLLQAVLAGPQVG